LGQQHQLLLVMLVETQQLILEQVVEDLGLLQLLKTTAVMVDLV
jgi:hypothetical protein